MLGKMYTFLYNKFNNILTIYNRLENLYEEAEETSKLLEKAHCIRDEYKKCGDALLYSMLPQSVADRLQNGEPAVSTCQVCIVIPHILLNINKVVS